MKIAILGGTGSFGSDFVHRYYINHDITVISRDETKQYEMRAKYPEVTYKIGDIRDYDRMVELLKGFDCIFQAAALKQVPSCEFFPMEAVKTNILGTYNVLRAARCKVVCLSTDKAVYPINAMGISKAMMEKVAIAQGAIITRYGNVMRSRGSVIPLWEADIKAGKILNVTDPNMTRFLLSLQDSIDLVMFAMKKGKPGDIFVKKAPACTMGDLAEAMDPKGYKVIGTRHGEKLHETLISSEEMARTEDMGDYFRVKPDARDMNYNQYFVEGSDDMAEAYTSKDTKLTVKQIKGML